VVDDGVTGWIVDEEAEAVQAVRQLGELAGTKVRSLTAKQMAQQSFSIMRD
jgi:hypothetical protein